MHSQSFAHTYSSMQDSMHAESLTLESILKAWRGGLIVSCQAAAGSPLAHPSHIAAFALTAEQNGAVGVRIEGADDIRAVRAQVHIPVLGIEKAMHADSEVYITPTFESAARIAHSGAHLIAVDATRRARPKGETLEGLVKQIRSEFGLPLMADVATFDEGIHAAETLGFELISTTLAGYTRETQGQTEPDFALIENLAKRTRTPVICEGRLRHAEHVARAFDCGAHAVVIGTAITGVDWLVRNFVEATKRKIEIAV